MLAQRHSVRGPSPACGGRRPAAGGRKRPAAVRRLCAPCSASAQPDGPDGAGPSTSAPAEGGRRALSTSRRELLLLCASGYGAAALQPEAAHAIGDAFYTLPSGLKVMDVMAGDGAPPRAGDVVAVHWAGWTKGYGNTLIDDTRQRDEPFVFRLGRGQAIPAFEEAVSSMRVGGMRRIEVLGSCPELGYPLERSKRITPQLIKLAPATQGVGARVRAGIPLLRLPGPSTQQQEPVKAFKYRLGPQPYDVTGAQALETVLTSASLRSPQRTLLFDIRLLGVQRMK